MPDEVELRDRARGFVNAAWLISRTMSDGRDIESVLYRIDPTNQLERSFLSFMSALSAVALWTKSSHEPGDEFELAGAVQIGPDTVYFLWQGDTRTWDVVTLDQMPPSIRALHLQSLAMIEK
jgi:hypothetical protein